MLNKQCLLNIEYRNIGVDCVSLCHADSKDDIAQLLVGEGWLLVEARREQRLAKLVSQYQKAQEKAKEGRVSIDSVNPVSSDGYISNVQCHAGLTYHFRFPTFGHSGAQG